MTPGLGHRKGRNPLENRQIRQDPERIGPRGLAFTDEAPDLTVRSWLLGLDSNQQPIG